MSAEAFSLSHIVKQPEIPAESPPMLILVHGYGSNEQDLMGLAPYLDKHLLIVSVRAPYRIMNMGYGWFELGFTPTGVTYSTEQALRSRDLLVSFVGEAVSTYNADPARVFLGGFSQGAMLSGAATFASPQQIAATVMMSGTMQQVPAPENKEALASKPFLVVHGTYDDVLPISNGRQARDVLQAAGVDLTYQEFPMGHEVNMDSLQLVRDWLAERINQ